MRARNTYLVLSILVGLLAVLACGQPAAGSPATSLPGEPAAEAPGEAQPTQQSLLPEATAAAPALPERRRLTLEFPARIRAGDADRVRLTLEVDDLGNITPTAEIGGNVVTGEVIEIPNLYESHHVFAETRFDIAGLEVSPADLASQPLTQNMSATFYWSIRPPEVGNYRGTVWLSLRFVDKASGAESQRIVSAQLVEIEAVNLLGLSGKLARTTGLVGSFVGSLLGLPFLEDIVKFLLKRRKRLA